MCAWVTYVPRVWLSMGPLPLLLHLECLPLTHTEGTFRICKLEGISSPSLASLSRVLSPLTLLLWLAPSFPHAWPVSVCLPWFPHHTHTCHATSMLTLPRACLSPHSLFRAFQWSLPEGAQLAGEAFGVLCLQLSRCSSLAPFWPWGATCRFLGRACSCLLPPCQKYTFSSLSTGRIFFKIHLQHYFSSSSSRVNVTTFFFFYWCPHATLYFCNNTSTVHLIYLFTWLWQWDLNSTPEPEVFPASYFWGDGCMKIPQHQRTSYCILWLVANRVILLHRGCHGR